MTKKTHSCFGPNRTYSFVFAYQRNEHLLTYKPSRRQRDPYNLLEWRYSGVMGCPRKGGTELSTARTTGTYTLCLLSWTSCVTLRWISSVPAQRVPATSSAVWSYLLRCVMSTWLKVRSHCAKSRCPNLQAKCRGVSPHCNVSYLITCWFRLWYFLC